MSFGYSKIFPFLLNTAIFNFFGFVLSVLFYLLPYGYYRKPSLKEKQVFLLDCPLQLNFNALACLKLSSRTWQLQLL